MKSRNYGMDYARLGLALSVMVGHFQHLQGHQVLQPRIAVPAFLAISGYFVLQSYEQSNGWRHFACKRLLRVGPPFVATFALLAVAGGWAAVKAAFITYATFGNLVPGVWTHINGRAAFMGPNPALWSLSCEEVAYLLLAALFVLGAYRKKWPITALFLASLIAIPIYHGFANGQRVVDTAIIPGFFGGSLLYIHRENALLKRLWPLGFVLFALCAVIAQFSPPQPAFFKFWYSWEGTGCGMGLLMWLLNWKVSLPKIPDLSYGVYVYHLSVALVFFNFALPWSGPTFFSAVFLVSLASWYLLERPTLRLKNRLGGRLDAPERSAVAEQAPALVG